MAQQRVDTESLIRQAVQDMDPYTPVTSLEQLSAELDLPIDSLVKLDANENPYGTPACILKAIASFHHMHIYPDPAQTAMREALARYTGLDARYIIGGAGGDELIDLLVRLVIEPGDSMIDCVPTFAMYAFSTQLCGGRVVEVERLSDFAVDTDGILRAVDERTKAVFIASPNNPTANVVPSDRLLPLLESGLLVVVDEAYYEFSGQTVAELVTSWPNLVVLRTFSKWAGLAGLRVGYAICHPEINRHLWKMQPPYNVSAVAQAAVCAAIDHLSEVRRPVCAILDERPILYRGLQAIDYLEPIPSESNFIFCWVRSRDARELRDLLRRQGILIRHFDRPLLRNAVRVSVGTADNTGRLLTALRRV